MAEEFDVLVIDDDREMRDSLSVLLTGSGFNVALSARADGIGEQLERKPPDVILCDVRMPGMTGMDLLKSLDRGSCPPLVLMSAHGDIPMAVEAMQEGAYSFLEKPFDPRRLLKLLSNTAKFHRLSQRNERLRARLSALSGLDRIIIGNSETIRALRDDIYDLSETTANVLITGETGTGKELVARAIHDLGPRSPEPFVPVNCVTIPLAYFGETMFGGADGTPGFLARADGGTLFLDELASIPLESQVKLLRVIETKQFERAGSTEPSLSDFRVLSASNERLTDALADGSFREDLYFRLNTIVLSLPALRHRRDDIPLLFTHFTDLFGEIYGISPPALTSDDLARLMSHGWPGNVRELRTVAERRVLAARRGGGSVEQALQVDAEFGEVPETLREAVAAFERQLISNALVANHGKMDAVAEALGIGRRTLNEKIVKLSLNKDEVLGNLEHRTLYRSH